MTKIQRIKSFEQAMLNTVVRVVRDSFDGLTLDNCLESEDFRTIARVALDQPLFTAHYEEAAVLARSRIIDRIEQYIS